MPGEHLSFYVRIDRLGPNYQVQPVRHGEHSFWSPPTFMNAYTPGTSSLFHWRGGNMTHIAVDDPIRSSLHQVFDAATVFTQNPDTPHLLVVPFDATTRHAFENPGGWRPLTFRHVRIGSSQRTLSFVSANGDRQHIAARGSSHWMPQLLPRVYDYQIGSPRMQAGLIGSLPLLMALAAFSAPPTALVGVLTNCLRLGQWHPHQFPYPSGHIAERGMIITIFYDPINPQGSNQAVLRNLQNGMFGPFYGSPG